MKDGTEERMMDRRPGASLGVIAVVALFITMDVTIVNVALPTIGGELRTSTTGLQWVVDAYNISLAGLLLPGSALGERIGRKRTLLAGLALFALGSLTAGFSGTLALLVASRAVMGVGAAFLLTSALSLISSLFPPEKRGHALGVWAGVGALGLALGPVAGGLLTSSLSWHWIFRINVPVMGAVFLAGMRLLPPGRGDAEGRPDLAGSLLSVTGLVMVLWALIEGPDRGWTSPEIPGVLAAGLLLLWGFVRRELRCLNPIFQIRVLGNRNVLGASLALFAAYLFFTGMLFLVPQHLEAVERTGTLTSGLALVPFAVVVWIFSESSESLARRLGATRVLPGALAALTAGFVFLAVTSHGMSLVPVMVGTCIGGIGLGLIIPAASAVILNALPPELTGTASGTSMIARFLGASFGVALVGTLLSVLFQGALTKDLAGSPAFADLGGIRSVQQALADADRLPAGEAGAFMEAVRGSFERAAALTYAACGALMGLMVPVTGIILRGRPSPKLSKDP
jgi:MFS transporter, DHA2 family, multidrug resistance protein